LHWRQAVLPEWHAARQVPQVGGEKFGKQACTELIQLRAYVRVSVYNLNR
jgi:hypothetical protein